ncbi:hypothetical protein MYCGRDRAFT_77854 [Paecilomyces variotii No. 5]|uniref:Alpha/beta hydrolase fold-3 domain-containing protein n=1 Tax=Byssochlamys spectabilis (strain No. 5 / NBRC 109023) TaxID=1356009 RepID=V5FQ69_BYSSN|nr:hypothetical protein MYCGRDRAFT_77854 [Paecilomyces variotii No. 5]
MSEYSPSWLLIEETFGGRFTLNGNAEQMREQFNGLVSALLPRLPCPSEEVASQDGEVDGIKYRIYLPRDVKDSERLPTVGHTHGGGYVLGNLDMEDALCRTICEHTRSAVISVDYRLAPEHKCPTQFEDTIRVFEWAVEHAESYHMDPTKFYTFGASAGAALALSIANHFIAKSKADPSLKPALVVKGIASVAPFTLHPDNVPIQYSGMYNSHEEFRTGAPCIDEASIHYFFEATNIEPTDERYLAALTTVNHADFPPTYLAVCECDPLRDDGIILAKMLEKAGAQVRMDFYSGLPHLFWSFPMLPESNEFTEKLIKGVNWLIAET